MRKKYSLLLITPERHVPTSVLGLVRHGFSFFIRLLTATIPQAGESVCKTTGFGYIVPIQAVIPRIPLLI